MKKLKIWLITLCLLISFFPFSVFAYTISPGTWYESTYTFTNSNDKLTLAEKRIHNNPRTSYNVKLPSYSFEGIVKVSSVWEFADLVGTGYSGNVLYYGPNNSSGYGNSSYVYGIVNNSKVDTGSSYEVTVFIDYVNNGSKTSDNFTLTIPYSEVRFIYKTLLILDYDNNIVTFELYKSPYGENVNICSWSLVNSKTYEVDDIVENTNISNYYCSGFSSNFYFYAKDYESPNETSYLRPLYSHEGSKYSSTNAFAWFDENWQFISYQYYGGNVEGKDVFIPYNWADDPKKITNYKIDSGIQSLRGYWEGPKYVLKDTGNSVTVAENRLIENSYSNVGDISIPGPLVQSGESVYSSIFSFNGGNFNFHSGANLLYIGPSYDSTKNSSTNTKYYSASVSPYTMTIPGVNSVLYTITCNYYDGSKMQKFEFSYPIQYSEQKPYVFKFNITLNYDAKTVTFDFLKSPVPADENENLCSWSLVKSKTFDVSGFSNELKCLNDPYYTIPISNSKLQYAYDYENSYNTYHFRPVYEINGIDKGNNSTYAIFDSNWQLHDFTGYTEKSELLEIGSAVKNTYEWKYDPKKYTVYGVNASNDEMIRYLLQKTYPISETVTATNYFSRIYSSYIKTLQKTPLEYITIMKNKYTPVSNLIYSAKFNTSYYHIIQKETDKIWNLVSNKTDSGFNLTFNQNAKVQNSFIMTYDVWKNLTGKWTLKWLYERGYVDYSTVGNNQVIYGRNDDIDNIKNGLFSKDFVRETIEFEKVVTTMDDLYSYDTEGNIKKFCYYASPVYYNEEDASYEWYYLVTYSGGYDSELKDIYNYYSYVSDDDGSRMYRMYDSIQPLSWNNPSDLLFDKQNDWKYVDHNIRDVVYKAENYDPSLDKNVIERDENVPIFNETTESEALENIGFKNLINAINGFMNEFSWFTDTLDTVQYYLLEYFYSCDNLIASLKQPQFLNNMKFMSDNLDWLYNNTILKYPVDFGMISSVVFAILF